MTYIHTVDDDAATGVVARAYEQGRASGGIYETTRVLSLWPEALTMEQRRYQTVMLDETALTRGEKEMIATAVSVKNRCAYCYAHHGAMMVEHGVDRGVARAICSDYRTAPIDARIRAMLDFATTARPDEARQEDVDRLRDAGFSDRQILEIIIVAGFFEDYNLRVSIFGLELENWAGEV